MSNTEARHTCWVCGKPFPHYGKQVAGGCGDEMGREGFPLAPSVCWLPGTVLLERHSVNILLSSQERKLTQAELPSAGHRPRAQYSMRPLSAKGGLFVLLRDSARAQSPGLPLWLPHRRVSLRSADPVVVQCQARRLTLWRARLHSSVLEHDWSENVKNGGPWCELTKHV